MGELVLCALLYMEHYYLGNKKTKIKESLKLSGI